MNFALVLALFGGDCHVHQVVTTHQAYAAPVVAAVQYPVFLYAAGDSAKVDALAKIAEQNAAILQQQTQLIQALNASPAAVKTSPNESAARAILQRSCVSCHSGAKPKGEIDLTGPLTVAQKMLVADSIESGTMPPKPADVLADADFQTVRKWAYEDKAAVRQFLKAAK